jgi:hypothetical protein
VFGPGRHSSDQSDYRTDSCRSKPTEKGATIPEPCLKEKSGALPSNRLEAGARIPLGSDSMINFFTAPIFSEDSVQGPRFSSQDFYSMLLVFLVPCGKAPG